MSIYTTLIVSRSAALAKIAELQKQKQLTNTQLGNLLDELLEHTLHNFRVEDDDITDMFDDGYLRELAGKNDFPCEWYNDPFVGLLDGDGDGGKCEQPGVEVSFRHKMDGAITNSFRCEEHMNSCNSQWEIVK